MIGAIVNQISEFSLILATLCVQAGIFDQKVFLLVTLATITTIFLSSVGHQVLGGLYRLFATSPNFLDRRSPAVREAELGVELKGHVVVAQYNELADKVIAHFLDAGNTVVLVDVDPDVYEATKGKHDKFRCMYADIFDPDTREDAAFAEAKAICSCLVDGQEAELSILRWLSESKLDIPLIAATDSSAEALELYEAGATYVIQTEALAAERLSQLLSGVGGEPAGLADMREADRASLTAASKGAAFGLL